MTLNFQKVPTPCYVCEEEKIKANLAILDRVQRDSGCHILLALKGFAMFSTFPLIRKVLPGTTASSLNEARLGFEEFGSKVHLCSPAYRDDEIDQLLSYSSHIVFNSFSQWSRFKEKALSASPSVSCGIRVNPEYSEVETPLYNPCAPRSRLGVTLSEFCEENLEGITGLHVHNHCESNSIALEHSIEVFEEKFGKYLKQMTWLNLGGGHHITRPDYDVDHLCRLIRRLKEKYNLEIFLEPGEAIALDSGPLVTSVLDIVHNEVDIAILDASAAAHMPDVLEMPYRPDVIGADELDVHPHNYILTGGTCLAGDVMGTYSFPEPLTVGSKIVFSDMLIYTMVKNTTFNGMTLPSIAIWSENDGLKIVRKFGYEDYKSRLS